MSERTHTPKPWKASKMRLGPNEKDRRSGIVINSEHEIDDMSVRICDMRCGQRDITQLRTDANLIEAAPELLEACKRAFRDLKPAGNVKKDFTGHLAIAELGRVIHKAEGKS